MSTMGEQESRRYLPLALFNTVDETVLNWLVDRDLLPKDIELKALLEGERRGDNNKSSVHYREAFNEAVIAALEQSEAPEFLETPYPDVISFYAAANWAGPRPLSMLSDDFHAFNTLYYGAKKLDVNPNMMYTVWHRLITEIDPTSGLDIAEAGHKTNWWYQQVANTYIRDEPAFEVYQDSAVQKRLRIGIGARAVKPLAYLLADNHPELFEEIDRA